MWEGSESQFQVSSDFSSSGGISGIGDVYLLRGVPERLLRLCGTSAAAREGCIARRAASEAAGALLSHLRLSPDAHVAGETGHSSKSENYSAYHEKVWPFVRNSPLQEVAAAEEKKVAAELQLHSDQGFQYTSQAYFNLTQQYGITPSMSRKGNPYDNAMAENFFSILKTECIYRHKPATFVEANEMIDRYICFFNHERIQLKTGEAPLA